LSDQTEKPKGALPKGYDANTPSTEVVKQKKINFLELVRYTSTDQDQREKDLKEYETSYIARLEKNKPEESSDDFRVELGVSTESDDDLGKLNLRKHAVTKREELQEERLAYEQKYLDRYAEPKIQKKKVSSSLYKPEIPKPKREMRKERKEYEHKYLSRYKQPKANLRKPLNLKSDDLGRLNLRKHTIAKRSEYLAKRKDYEEKYILRYMKKLKAEPKRSSSKNLDHDLISGRLNLRAFVDKKRHEIKTGRTEYEKKYISKYKESKASIKKSKSLTESDDLGKFTISTKTTALKKLRAERAEYEKQYLVRYSKQRKAKPKKKVASSDLYKPEIPKPKRDVKKERKEYEQKYLSRYKEPKTKKNVGSDLYKPEIPKPKRNMKKERKEYEQKYLSRYKQPKSGVKKSTSWTQHDVDLGRLTLSQHFNAKRRAKQDEIKEYEKQYLSRYKQPKTKKNVGSDLYKPEIPKPKLDMKKERKKYEQKYLSRYKQPKIQKKKVSSSLYKPEIPKPKLDMKKERKE